MSPLEVPSPPPPHHHQYHHHHHHHHSGSPDSVLIRLSISMQRRHAGRRLSMNMNRSSNPSAPGPTTSVRATRSRSSHSSPSRHVPQDSHHIPSATVEVAVAKQEAPRVVLGYDAVSRLPNELGRLCLSSPLIVSSPSRMSLSKRIQSLLPNLDSCVLDSDSPLSAAMVSGRDSVISVGGASAVALARAISVKKGIPHICVPTTHSGSDDPRLRRDDHGFTPDFRLDDADNSALPAVIIYDEKLTMSHPKRFSAPSAAPSVTKSNNCRSGKSNTAQWSFIHLPGV